MRCALQSKVRQLDSAQRAILPNLTGGNIGGKILFQAVRAYNGVAMVVSRDKSACKIPLVFPFFTPKNDRATSEEHMGKLRLFHEMRVHGSVLEPFSVLTVYREIHTLTMLLP